MRSIGQDWNTTTESYFPVPCNHDVGSPNLFTGAVSYSDYGYQPNLWSAYLWVSLEITELR